MKFILFAILKIEWNKLMFENIVYTIVLFLKRKLNKGHSHPYPNPQPLLVQVWFASGIQTAGPFAHLLRDFTTAVQ